MYTVGMILIILGGFCAVMLAAPAMIYPYTEKEKTGAKFFRRTLLVFIGVALFGLILLGLNRLLV
jgi:hypothetical protein